jgi:hypothetical protein
VDTAGWPIPELVDQALATYIDWRGTEQAVTHAYQRWSAGALTDKATRFAAYMAALDQEQTAAGEYARSISELERWLPDSG